MQRGKSLGVSRTIDTRDCLAFATVWQQGCCKLGQAVKIGLPTAERWSVPKMFKWPATEITHQQCLMACLLCQTSSRCKQTASKPPHHTRFLTMRLTLFSWDGLGPYNPCLAHCKKKNSQAQQHLANNLKPRQRHLHCRALSMYMTGKTLLCTEYSSRISEPDLAACSFFFSDAEHMILR